MPEVGALRETLSASAATWTVSQALADGDQLPRYPTGATTEGLVAAEEVSKLDLSAILVAELGNPFLLARRVERGYLPRSALEDLGLESWIAPVPAAAYAAPSSLDWRQRWGWPWITGIRDQNGCNACWAFAATALVESMVRIEHAVWCIRSEGDVHKGIGAVCASLGNSGAALDWMRDNGGLADPDCFPWTTADIPYNPTPDRPGRTVRVPTRTNVGSMQDQKDWLDTVGPIVTWFEVWTDFFGYGTGVYQKSSDPANKAEGGHLMLVVGYDDPGGYWIVKNSWGTWWGEAGYCRIAYGECDVDTYAKIGLRNTNPDPWTKRRLHSGNMIESGNGALHRNFEMLATHGGDRIRHWWRDGGDFSWHGGATFGRVVQICPTLTGTTFNRNFESVHLTKVFRLHHWRFDQDAGAWQDGGAFGPLDAAAVPGFLQSNYGTPGNFEVIIRTVDGQLNHWWRMNGPPWTWTDAGRFGSNVAHSGATLVQSNHGDVGHFEFVCVLDNGQMQRWVRDNDLGTPWQAQETFGSEIDSPPCMIEGQYGADQDGDVGNFELCVALRGQVQHWWRDNSGGTGWHHSATFGHDVERVVALVEGSYGFNLEVVVLRHDGMLQHYWRDGGGWHEGAVIGSA